MGLCFRWFLNLLLPESIFFNGKINVFLGIWFYICNFNFFENVFYRPADQFGKYLENEPILNREFINAIDFEAKEFSLNEMKKSNRIQPDRIIQSFSWLELEPNWTFFIAATATAAAITATHPYRSKYSFYFLLCSSFLYFSALFFKKNLVLIPRIHSSFASVLVLVMGVD